MTEYTPTTDDLFSWLSSITTEEDVRSVRRWLAEHDRQVQAEALERVREEIRALACWADPVTGSSGFNLGNDEDGEAGARMAVLDILSQAIRQASND